MIFIQIFMNESAYCPLLVPYRIRADRIMALVNVFLLMVCLGLAPMHDTWLVASAIGIPTTILGFWLSKNQAGSLLTRFFMSSAFMIFTGLIIHQSAGDIEAHFAAFGLIGVLLYYRDWRTIFVATVVIYLHHLLLGYAQTLGLPIYVFDNQQFWITYAIHVAYFLPFVGMMIYLSIWLRREGYETQRAIAIAEQIVQGHLIKESTAANDEQEMPLVHAVRMMKNRLLDLLEVLPVATAVIRTDTEQVVSLNEAWTKKWGYKNLAVHQSIRQSFMWIEPSAWDHLLTELHRAKDKLINKTEVLLNKDETSLMIGEISMVLHSNMLPEMIILTIEDITQRREAEKTMMRLAQRDLLTDLPNRLSLLSALDAAHTDWRNHSIPYAVIMMDLDGFKPINDTYGHDAGDEVLKIIAIRLKNVNRYSDMVARLGGDEFTVILRDCANTNVAVDIAHRMLTSVSEPIVLEKTGGITVTVGISMGIAHIQDFPQSTVEIMLKHADTALYAAKSSGKQCIKVYTQTPAKNVINL